MRAAYIFLALVVGCGASVPPQGRSYVDKAQCWADPNEAGEYHIFNDNNPHLGGIGFDNTIESVRVTGVWMFYNEAEYSAHLPSGMCYVYGIDFFLNFPQQCRNMATSIRYACDPYELNGDCWAVYDLTFFRGESMFGTEDMPDLSYLSHDTSSIILSGQSAWTFCTETHYSGHCYCLTPDTYHDEQDMQVLDLGIFEELPQIENRIKSVRKGCHSKSIITSSSHRHHHMQGEKGGYGILKMN